MVVGGFRLLNLTSAWCWMDWTAEALRHKKEVYKTVRDWLDFITKEMGLVRLMACVKTDFPAAIRTIEHLGFCRESIMKHFYGEKDAYLYVRLDWSL